VSERSRVSRRRIIVNGRTTDRECSPDGRIVRTRRRLARVEVSVGTRSAKQCRYLTSSGRLSPARDCAQPIYVRARVVRFIRSRAKSFWRLSRSARLRRGRYTAIVRGVDRDGNVEIKQRPTNRATLIVR